MIQLLDIDRIDLSRVQSLERYFPLSKSESEIAKLIVKGHSNHEIAEIRGRSLETVKTQVRSIFQKTYTSSRTELAQLSFALSQSQSLLNV